MPRKGGKRNGSKKKKKEGVSHKSQRKHKASSSGFCIRRRTGKLNLSSWKDEEDSVRQQPVKRKRSRAAVVLANLPNYSKPRDKIPEVEFRPADLHFKPFKPTDDVSDAVDALQKQNLKAFETQFGSSDKADRKRRRDLNRNAVAASQRITQQKYKSNGSRFSLLYRDDELNTENLASSKSASMFTGKTSLSHKQTWDQLFPESGISLDFISPEQAALAAEKAKLEKDQARLRAQEIEQAELGDMQRLTSMVTSVTGVASTLIPSYGPDDNKKAELEIEDESDDPTMVKIDKSKISVFETQNFLQGGDENKLIDTPTLADASIGSLSYSMVDGVDLPIQDTNNDQSLAQDYNPNNDFNDFEEHPQTPLTKVADRWSRIAVGGEDRSSPIDPDKK